MKRFKILGLVALAAATFTACQNVDYKTTTSGLKYKIISGNSKDSVKVGDVLKMNVTQSISGSKDSVLFTTYGKAPYYGKVQAPPMPGQPAYGPEEVFSQLRKGDSLVSILLIDSLISKGLLPVEQLPPFMKKGDKLTITFKVVDVFTTDSLAQADQMKEQEKDAPRAEKERKEMEAKFKKEAEEKAKADEVALEKSGEKAKQVQFVKDYLSKKGITANPTAVGTFIKIDNPGTGGQVADGKYVTVKYTGKKMANDSTFESSSFTYQPGVQSMIKGFDDGLKQFKQGGKGTIFIPGYLAYGKSQPGSPFGDYEALKFDVEITSVSDTPPAPPAQPTPPTKSK